MLGRICNSAKTKSFVLWLDQIVDEGIDSVKTLFEFCCKPYDILGCLAD